jgi:hypothetical protein
LTKYHTPATPNGPSYHSSSRLMAL